MTTKTPLIIDYWFSFQDEDRVRQFARNLPETCFVRGVSYSEEYKIWMLAVGREQEADYDIINATEGELGSLAVMLGGTSDGWAVKS